MQNINAPRELLQAGEAETSTLIKPHAHPHAPLLVFLSLLVIPFALPAASLPEPLNVPGGIALEPVEARDGAPPEVSFADGRVAVVEDGEDLIAVVGVPLDTQPGEQWLDMRWPDGVHARQSFTVGPKDYDTQYLTITDERKVEPLAEDLERIYKEQAITEEALSVSYT